jgi:hypothetical protein
MLTPIRQLSSERRLSRDNLDENGRRQSELESGGRCEVMIDLSR